MIFSSILIFFIGIGGINQNIDDTWHLVSDLKKEWVVYDRESKLYSPYIEDIHIEYNTVNLNLALTEYPGCYLSIDSDAEISVFFNNKLVDYYQGKGHRNYSLDSIKSIVGKNQIFITILIGRGN